MSVGVMWWAGGLLGAAQPFVIVGVVVLVVLGVTGYQLRAGMNPDIEWTREPVQPMSASFLQLTEHFRSLGFSPAPLLRYEMSSPALMQFLVSRDGEIVVESFQLLSNGFTGFALNTWLDDGDVMLITSPLPSSGVLPTTPGKLRQSFPGATPEACLQSHLEALGILRSRGFRADKAGDDVERRYRDNLRRTREVFDRSPLKYSALGAFRALTGSSPHPGSIATQPAARAEIERLVAQRAATPVQS